MKAWYKSKTMIFNLLSIVLIYTEQYHTMIGSAFGDLGNQIATGAILVGNIILRSVTKSGVSFVNNTKGGTGQS